MAFLLFVWIVGSLLIGLVGKNRDIGFWPIFLISLVGSPAIGFIVAICSKRKNTIRRMIENQELQMRQFNTAMSHSVNNIHAANIPGSADELLKLKELLDKGVLTQSEYEQQKAKILSR